MDEKSSKTTLITKFFNKGKPKVFTNSSVRWVTDHWETEGSASIRDLEQAIDSVIDIDTEVKTVSELLIRRLDYVPNPGDQIIENGMSFLVLDMKSHRIGRVHIYPSTTRNH